MRKASKILSIIGGIFVILTLLYVVGTIVLMLLASVGLGIAGTVFLGLSFVGLSEEGAMVFSFQYILEDPTVLLPSLIFYIAAIVVLIVTVITIVEAVICLVNAILALKGSGKKAKKGTHIAGIVFDVLYLMFFGSMFAGVGIIGAIVGFLGILIDFLLVLLGHIFGLIALKKEQQA